MIFKVKPYHCLADRDTYTVAKFLHRIHFNFLINKYYMISFYVVDSFTSHIETQIPHLYHHSQDRNNNIQQLFGLLNKSFLKHKSDVQCHKHCWDTKIVWIGQLSNPVKSQHMWNYRTVSIFKIFQCSMFSRI